MDAIEALRTRRSVRKYTSDPVSQEDIETLIDAGRLAATAINIQPWEFIVVQDEAMRKKIADITDYGAFIAHAPLCIIVVCKDTKYYLEDGCAATQNILVAARALGLGSCWVAGDKKDYLDHIASLLSIPSGYRIVSLISVGYPAGEPSMPGKRSVKEVLHQEKF